MEWRSKDEKGAVGEIRIVQRIMMKSSHFGLMAIISYAAFLVLPPLIFVVCPILKKFLEELSSRPIDILHEVLDNANLLSSKEIETR